MRLIDHGTLCWFGKPWYWAGSWNNVPNSAKRLTVMESGNIYCSNRWWCNYLEISKLEFCFDDQSKNAEKTIFHDEMYCFPARLDFSRVNLTDWSRQYRWCPDIFYIVQICSSSKLFFRYCWSANVALVMSGLDDETWSRMHSENLQLWLLYLVKYTVTTVIDN